jgi:hypothetical protein
MLTDHSVCGGLDRRQSEKGFTHPSLDQHVRLCSAPTRLFSLPQRQPPARATRERLEDSMQHTYLPAS